MPTVLPAWPLPRSPAQTQNLNVFKPVDLKQKCQQVERALHFQLQVPDLTRGRRHVQAFTENSELKGKYHSFAVRERHQRAGPQVPSALRSPGLCRQGTDRPRRPLPAIAPALRDRPGWSEAACVKTSLGNWVTSSRGTEALAGLRCFLDPRLIPCTAFLLS